MSIKVRFLSLFAAACLTATTLGDHSTSSAAVGIGDAISADKFSAKISDELQAVLDESQDDDMIPVYIWTNDIDYETVERKTVQTTSLSKDTLMAKSSSLYEPLTASLAPDVMEEVVAGKRAAMTSSEDYETAAKITKDDTLSQMQDFYSTHKTELAELSDTVDMYIDTKRSFARKAYNEQNGGFANNYLKDAKIIFQSQYAPMIICELPKRTILYLNTLNNVVSLSLYEDIEFAAAGNIEIGVKSIKGNAVRDGHLCDGKGVKVGQIDVGLPDSGAPELRGTKIILGDTSSKDNHATLVAAIMTGNKGMAPAAELYSASYNNFYANVEWLISSGVSVINMSAYKKEPSDLHTGYGTVVRWVDHVVYQHGVSWVNATGNHNFGSDVLSPATGYNVIGVGGIDDNGTESTVDDKYYEKTSYTVVGGMPNKPDVVAPAVGFNLSTDAPTNGTSYSAPHVTGMIAQMMSFCPTLKFEPAAIKAAVVASCDRKTTGEALGVITDKEGAGVVNALNAIYCISNVMTQRTYYNTSAKTITFDFTPNTTGMKTVAISWLKHCEGTNADHSNISSYGFSNFDLYVLDSKGNVVKSSKSLYNSVEMVRFNATAYNKYTIEIRRVSSGTSEETISLAHTN